MSATFSSDRVEPVVHQLRPEPVAVKVEVIQTDNGAEFQTAFHWHMLDNGIGHVYITPRLNGEVERSHRIDAEEFYRLLDGVVIDDAKVFNGELQEWEDYYNYHRPPAPSADKHPMKTPPENPPGCRRSTTAAHLGDQPTEPTPGRQREHRRQLRRMTRDSDHRTALRQCSEPMR